MSKCKVDRKGSIILNKHIKSISYKIMKKKSFLLKLLMIILPLAISAFGVGQEHRFGRVCYSNSQRCFCNYSANMEQFYLRLQQPDDTSKMKNTLFKALNDAAGNVDAAGLEKIDWEKRFINWTHRYLKKRQDIESAPTREQKLRLIHQLHEEMAGEEAKKIRAIEELDPPLCIESKMLKRSEPWNAGLEEEKDTKWDKDDYNHASGYLYHGTSLGIAYIYAALNQMRGIAGLTAKLDPDGQIHQRGEAIYFAHPNYWMYAINYEKASFLGGIIAFTADYAVRQIRPARAVTAYYAWRSYLQENNLSFREGISFPPLEYFSLRAIIRVPLDDVGLYDDDDYHSDITGAETRTYKSVPLDRAEILIDRDISYPDRIDYSSGEGLGQTDPENLKRAPVDAYLYTKQFKGENKVYNTRKEEANPFLENIGNFVKNKWICVKDFLRIVTVSQAALVIGPEFFNGAFRPEKTYMCELLKIRGYHVIEADDIADARNKIAEVSDIYQVTKVVCFTGEDVRGKMQDLFAGFEPAIISHNDPAEALRELEQNL